MSSWLGHLGACIAKTSEDEEWSGIVDRKIWLRLKIWETTGSEMTGEEECFNEVL